MTNNRRRGDPSSFGSFKRVFRPLINYAFWEDRENFARYPKWGKCYPCKFLFPPFRVSELLRRNIVIWSYLPILAKTWERRRKRATRDRSERKRKDRRTVWRRHDLRRKGLGVSSLRTYFNARTLSRIGSAGICLPNEKFCCLTSLAVFVYSGTLPAIQISSYLSPRETQDGKTTRSYRVAFRKALLDPGKAANVRDLILDIRIIIIFFFHGFFS